MRCTILLPAALALAASACGGTFGSSIPSDGGDAGSEAAPTDARSDKIVVTNETGCVTGGQPRGDGGCFIDTPTEGSCCNTGDTICQQGNPCCVGLWSCSPSTHTWIHEGLGCACEIDAGPPVDAPSTDTGSSRKCGTLTCNSSEICVEQTTTGGPCLAKNDAGMCPPGTTATGDCCSYSNTTYSCHAEPGVCGGTLSCGCASSLCSCMCSGAVGRTLECVCLGA